MKNEKEKRYNRAKTAEVADIGVIPSVADSTRRDRCRLDLHRFLKTYFPFSTGLKPFGPDQVRAIGRIQECFLVGGRFVEHFPRGFAKSTIAENSALWAVLYGHRRFVPIFGADAPAAAGNLSSIKLELSDNDLLYEDFPEVCHAIRALDGKPQRCGSQTHRPGNVEGQVVEGDVAGELTHIGWTSERLVLPTIRLPNGLSPASGGIIVCRSLMGGARGMKFKRADGTQQRPDCVLIDDPQTDESAASPAQTDKRLGIIRKSLLKLGGHDRQLAVLMAATVIEPNDLVDQLLDSKRNPSWQGERIPMVQAWGKAKAGLWLTDYAALRNKYDADVPGAQQQAHKRATAFYRKNRKAMDEGMVVSWRHCFDSEVELSAIQHAFNMLIDDGEEVFASECQGKPKPKMTEMSFVPVVKAVTGKANGVKRGVIPAGHSHLAVFVDVQESSLWWMAVSAGEGFTPHVVNYGVYPEQNKAYVALKDVKRTLVSVHGGPIEAAWPAALESLTGSLAGREWPREDGASLRVEREVVDANYGASTKTVRDFCRRSSFATVLIPSHGRYVSASSTPLNERQTVAGEKVGHNWRISVIERQRHLVFDTNAWKSLAHRRLALPVGAPGGITLFGAMGDHAMLADHLCAEFPVEVMARGRTIQEWKLLIGRDNHLLDCLVGALVALNLMGLSVGGGITGGKSAKRKRVSFAAMKAGQK